MQTANREVARPHKKEGRNHFLVLNGRKAHFMYFKLPL
tara:strand:- start:7 stop:120 length:114 start_codon:yes stop_codon:yes gene_type:complete